MQEQHKPASTVALTVVHHVILHNIVCRLCPRLLRFVCWGGKTACVPINLVMDLARVIHGNQNN